MKRGLAVIKLVIVDLDNTIYNWVDYYVPSFNAMVKELVRLTGIDEQVLRASFKRVHQKHKTAEYAFSIEELDVLSESNAGLKIPEILQKYNPAINAFRSMRKKTLRRYDNVIETLEKLRSKGKKMVAHTDAMMFYAVYRVKELGVERFFDGIVAPRDHGLPKGVRPRDVRSQSDEKYETIIPFKKELEPEIVKPNLECLNEILRYFGVDGNEAVYVGDSLHRDIYMAQRCGVYDVYAEYGRQYDANYYQQLVEITYWTDEEVAREQELKALNISPSFKIQRFSDLIGVIQNIESRVTP